MYISYLVNFLYSLEIKHKTEGTLLMYFINAVY